MKKNIIILYLFLFTHVCIYTQIRHKLVFSSDIQIEEKQLEDRETYTLLSMPETDIMNDSVGYPALPVKYIKLLVPFNVKITGIQLNEVKKQSHLLNAKIEPIQYPIPISLDYRKENFVKPNASMYDLDLPFPANLIEIINCSFFRENQIITLAVYPCRYFPKKNLLEQYESIDFSLLYSENKAAKPTKQIKRDPEYQQILKSLIENKNDITKYTAQTIEKEPLNVVASSSVNPGYVIITNAEIALAFNEFIAWKRQKGLKIMLVTMEHIRATYTGDNISGIYDDAGKVRQFLANAYDGGNGIKYVLLGGDQNVVPIRYGYSLNNTTNTSYIIPTDLYFSEFTGNWDVDRDGRYGEPEDNVNFNSSVYVGRILVSNQDEVKNWTKKVLTYEKNPGNGDYSYLKRAFYTQADQLQDYIPGGQARYIAKKFYTVYNDSLIWEEMYQGIPNPYSPVTPDFPSGRSIISQINAHKYAFLSWFAHGHPIGVGVGTKEYNINDSRSKYNITSLDNHDALYGNAFMIENENGMDNLTNENYPAINYSISCVTMPFDDYSTPTGAKNLAKAFTCLTKGGGPAYIGNTRNGYVATSFRLFEQFVKVITDGTSYHVGEAEAISKQRFTQDRYIRFSHNLIGCPEMEMWTDIPSKFVNVSVSQSGTSITVNTGGVSGCTIAVTSMDYGATYFNVANIVSSDTTFTGVTVPCYVTITKHNYIPYIYPEDVYIQNVTIANDSYISGRNIYVGRTVTTEKPQGNVVVNNNASVIFKATQNVIFDAGFECKLGASYEVTK